MGQQHSQHYKAIHLIVLWLEEGEEHVLAVETVGGVCYNASLVCVGGCREREAEW